MSISTPVVFTIFNRPNLTKRVFEEIARAKPRRLFVIADGPRFPEEAEKCREAREVVEKVDWNCELATSFSETNMGCGIRPASGLNWVFSEVEEAIILEDDCLPAPSFFSFCETLLKHYRDDLRIMHISGNNFQPERSHADYSYYFSKYSHQWGWATWRRAWKYFDYDMTKWTEFRNNKSIEVICEDPYEQKYWTQQFDRIHEGVRDIWDAQWLFACWSQSGLSILPNKNLVSNIGFGQDATHTIEKRFFAELPTADIWEIRHPPVVVRNRRADAQTFEHVFGGKYMRQNSTLRAKLRRGLLAIKTKLEAWL